MFSPGDLVTGIYGNAWPTAPAATVADDLSVQAGTTNVSSPSTTNTVNRAATPATKSTLNYSAAIVIVSIILLWMLGGLVFKGVSS